MALWIMVSFVCYLRPCECFELKVRPLVAPSAMAGPAYQAWGPLLHDVAEAQPGKTGLFEES
eukprot:3937442-Pyramimonas_sp.AAC.1